MRRISVSSTVPTVACAVALFLAGPRMLSAGTESDAATTDTLKPQPISFRAPVASDVAAIQIQATKDSEVIVDGKNVGAASQYRRSKSALSLAPGTHTLEVQRAGYETMRMPVTVEGGKRYQLHFQLRRASER